MKLKYLSGFQNIHSSEALNGALPKNQNSPQKLKYNLYPEQFSTTAFTAPQRNNLKSWLYRKLPSVGHKPFRKYKSFNDHKEVVYPEALRWDPISYPKQKVDFVDSIKTFCTSGSQMNQTGCAVHMYSCTSSMTQRCFQNSDAEMLIVPQEGNLLFKTEFGDLEVQPLEIIVLPKGMKFQVILQSPKARGYILENFGSYLRLPDLGPIGANGLANARHFLAPVAAFDDSQKEMEWIHKFQGELFLTTLESSPFNVVAWYGNTYPYKYDLNLFNTINTVSFDHPDPSIFTVLTSPSSEHGIANIDFVIFPPRWMVAENTFRPPYFHRNCMSEFMGLITGEYDAKQEGFNPGGCSLHNSMVPHGPDVSTYQKASSENLKPHKISNTMAFMFETRYPFRTTDWAIKNRQKKYLECWYGFEYRKT